MPDNESSSLRKILSLVALLLAFFVALTCFYQTRATEAVVLTTFERPVAVVTEPGLRMKWPWPIQKDYRFDMRSRLYQSQLDDYLVKDGYNVKVRAFVCWAIGDVGLYKNKVGVRLADGEDKLATLLGKYLNTTLSDKRMSDLVGVGAGGLAGVEAGILAPLRKDAKDSYGIEVSAFGFDRLELPEEATEAVFERMKAERQTMVAKITSEGKAKAMRIREEATSEQKRLIAEAEAEAVRIRGEADTKAFEYLEVYKKRPNFALFLKKLQALESSMRSKTTLILDRNVPPFDMLSPDVLKRLETNESKD